MTMGIGVTNMEDLTVFDSVRFLFSLQQKFQHQVQEYNCLTENFGRQIVSEFPCDSPVWFQYHVTAMAEELGEILKADKRWKTHRNERYERDEKLDELADIFITAMNIAMYSGFSSDDVTFAIKNKIEANSQKLIAKSNQHKKKVSGKYE